MGYRLKQVTRGLGRSWLYLIVLAASVAFALPALAQASPKPTPMWNILGWIGLAIKAPATYGPFLLSFISSIISSAITFYQAFLSPDAKKSAAEIKALIAADGEKTRSKVTELEQQVETLSASHRQATDDLKKASAEQVALLKQILAHQLAGTTLDPEALKALNNGITTLSESATPLDEQAKALILQGQVNEALALLRTAALTNLPDAVDRWRTLAEIAFSINTHEAINAYEQVCRLSPDDFWAHIMLARLYERGGNITKALNLYENLLLRDINDWNRALALEGLGKIRLKMNDLSGAMSAQQKALDLRQNIYLADTADQTALRNLSVSLEKIGDVYLDQGQTDLALKAYSESLDIDRTLAKDKTNAKAQRDLSISLNKIGDVYFKQDQTDLALKAYSESLDIRHALAKDKTNAQAQRDLSISLKKIGNIYLKQDQTELALKAYSESLEIARTLATDETNAQAQRDLSISLNKIGDVYLIQGQTNLALKAYSESLEIARTLATDETNAVAQRDLWLSLWYMAIIVDTKSTWQAFIDQFELMKSKGQLQPQDEEIYAQALENIKTAKD